MREILRNDPKDSFLRICAIGILVSWVLTIQLWILSPWLLVHLLVPGAGGLRVVVRYQLFLTLPLFLLVAAAQRQRIAALWAHRPMLVVAGVVLLFAEQLNGANPAKLDRPKQLAELETVPAPPAECRSFFVVAARPDASFSYASPLPRLYPHNVDAMYLAERWRVPTVNGFSTFNPPYWDFADPDDASYRARVKNYAARNRLDAVCGLDMRRKTAWSRL
jgi:hypothetical protein